MFTFKKIASQFFMPLPFSLLLSFAGLYLLWLTSKKKAGQIMVTAGILSLAMFSFPPFAHLLIAPLEKEYRPFDLQMKENIKYVVVLGGGHIYDPSIPPTSRLSYPTMMRLTEGIRLLKEIPGSRLLLSGGGTESPDTEADSMLTVALSLGVKRDRIILETESRDTKDEARIIKEIVKSSPFVLVTSAAHMKRSMALFRKMGMKPIGAPTDYMTGNNIKGKGFGFFTPKSDAIIRVEKAIHEYLGILWAKIRGQV